ncbi:hypothetical protein KUV59_16855 [Marinobacter daepoensis]|uniref:hypothetical protein n=1 Tax=Marinobacter daepoensis TaxID=262077 RepID=UPI001C95ABFE|nr:hypothetical protein [Marinobacter daepoensis]MBY6034848.1 hypothetical protein [Marinobacter daepoensis]
MKRENERSLIPLLIVSGVVAAPIIFILGLVTGSQIQLSNLLTADSLSSWTSALATVAIAILTFILAKETWYLREAQIEQVNELKRENIRPNVSLRLKNSPVSFNLIEVEINNLGKGIARNLKFKFSDSSGSEIFETDNPIVDEFLKLHIFSEGIHSLGIGQKVESFLFSFFDLKGKLDGDDVFSPFFKIEITFSDVNGEQYSNELVVDFKEYKGVSEVGGGDPLHKIADDLNKLTEQFGKVVNSSPNRLQVNTYSSADREEESRLRQQRYEDWKKQQEKKAEQ